jgi:hypothetical protein
MLGYKLFRQRKDGTLGPLFINARLRVPVGEWLEAEDHPTKGFAHRPGWHATLKQEAPHLSEKGRVWCRVALEGCKLYDRPESQGGTWVLAERLKVLEVLKP